MSLWTARRIADEGAQYELVAGERRLRCAQRLGWDTIPAMVRPTDDADLLRDALLENIHRAALNPLEEAAAYQQLLADFGCTQEELVGAGGTLPPADRQHHPIASPSPGVQRRVAAGVLSQGHARALLSLPDDASMEALATRIVAEGLSVRSVEEIVALGDHPHEVRARRPRRTSSDDDLQEVAEESGRSPRHSGQGDHGQGQGAGSRSISRAARTWRGSSTSSPAPGHRPRTEGGVDVHGGTRQPCCGQPPRRWPGTDLGSLHDHHNHWRSARSPA